MRTKKMKIEYQPKNNMNLNQYTMKTMTCKQLGGAC